jgi:hypothetical protein
VRSAVTVAALVFVGALGLGTVYVLLTEGPDILTLASVLVVALLGFGIFGALTEPPDERR